MWQSYEGGGLLSTPQKRIRVNDGARYIQQTALPQSQLRTLRRMIHNLHNDQKNTTPAFSCFPRKGNRNWPRQGGSPQGDIGNRIDQSGSAKAEYVLYEGLEADPHHECVFPSSGNCRFTWGKEKRRHTTYALRHKNPRALSTSRNRKYPVHKKDMGTAAAAITLTHSRYI